MATTTFVDNTSIIYATWLNDVNSAIYNGTFISPTITPSNIVCNGSVSGTGFIGLVNNTLSAPGAIGSGTPNTGAFTTLSASTPLGIGSGGTALSASGSAGNVLTSNGTVWASSPKLALGTAVTSTSGTSIDFTGIPSWVKRVTVIFNEVSTSGSSYRLIQLGSTSIANTGYLATSSILNTAVATTSSAIGFPMFVDNTTYVVSGQVIITNVSGNIWVASYSVKYATAGCVVGGGSVTLAGVLDRVRITTINGTDTFDAGSINIMYE